ncbi:DUF2695 domain-containing protein [Arthrobacter sp. USHLN218]|uniref:DUF2695 domain-containing protein n=1 Tax=Arthrobacter sp. USHLN218 TaxID=3081232 RepID=UPI0030161DC2
MDQQPVPDIEDQLRLLSDELTLPKPGECLLCYTYRMLEFGCNGLVWARRYRDVAAPRATALEARLAAKGGYCDCEIFANGYEPNADLWDPRGYCEEHQPGPLPPCQQVRLGSTQPCRLWRPRWRPPGGRIYRWW